MAKQTPMAPDRPDTRLSKWQVQQLDEPSEGKCRPHGHEGCVFIDQLADGSQVVTHCLTLRSQTLPDSFGACELVFSDDNNRYGAIVDFGKVPSVHTALEDFLSRQLYVSPKGILQVAEMDANMQIIGKWCLTDRLRDFDAHVVEVNGSKLHDSINAFYVRWPRDSFHWFWGLHSLYVVMKLQLCMKVPSKWSYQLNQSGQLPALADKFGLSCTYLKGNNNLSSEEALTTTTAFLKDEICVFAYMFMLLCDDWCMC